MTKKYHWNSSEFYKTIFPDVEDLDKSIFGSKKHFPDASD